MFSLEVISVAKCRHFNVKDRLSIIAVDKDDDVLTTTTTNAVCFGSVCMVWCLLLEHAVCGGNLAHEVVINLVRVQVRDRDYQSEIHMLSANLAFIPARFTLIILSIG